MKKQVIEYIRSLGGISAYSGKSTMVRRRIIGFPSGHWEYQSNTTIFITENKPKDKQSIEECILNKFGYNLPFRLQTN